jgi:SAM-dependent methyltransferase
MPKSEWQEYFDGHAYRYMAEEPVSGLPYEDEAAFYLEVLDLPAASRILDVGCGTGRHAVEMAKRGYAVTGLDFSAGMLAEAKKRALEAGVSVEWIHADATEYVLPTRADGAICMLEAAVGLLGSADDAEEHDSAVLRNVSQSLEAGAPFLLGASNALKIVRMLAQADVDGGSFDPVSMVNRGSATWTTPEGAKKEVTVRFRNYTVPELSRLLQQAGFSVEHVWGGTYGRRPIQLDEYMITVAARKVVE